jgi:stage II sporulation protein D
VTYFFNSSGGHTENIENVWIGSRPEPWLRGVPDPYDNAGGDPYHRWGYNLTVGGAASRLGRLVKGRLVGVQVTKHGVSPRILTADVVGTRGRSHVTGTDVQRVFGLYTTYAAFTTISSAAGSRPAKAVRLAAGDRAPQGAQAVVALVPLVRELLAGVPMLQGSVFPGRRGDGFDVQSRGGHGWHTVSHSQLGSGGSYAVDVPGPGTYRILYRGLAGPAVTVS